MPCCITVLFCLLVLLATKTTYGFAHEEKIQEIKGNTSTSELLKIPSEHHGIKRNLGFSNFFEGWLTPWQTYEETEFKVPRVPLLRITPAFFKVGKFALIIFI